MELHLWLDGRSHAWIRHPSTSKIKSPSSRKSLHAPHLWVIPVYISRQQQTPKGASKDPLLDKDGPQRIHSITIKFLHYGRAFNPCILPALIEISSKQDKTNTDRAIKCDMLMDYLHTNPDAFNCYHTSDMILKIVSDSAFLVLPQAQSLSTVIYQLVWKDNKKQYGLVYVFCQTIKKVVASASESETGGLYLGNRHGFPLCIVYIETRHPQPENGTSFEADTITAHGILTSNMSAKISKAFDMRYWWIKDRIK